MIRLAVKKKAASTPKKARGKKAKEAKDPNKPKRILTNQRGLLIFLQFDDVEIVIFVDPLIFLSFQGGFPDTEKAPFIAKVEKRKAEYEKTLQTYNKKLAEGKDIEEEEDEESDKSKLELKL
uniref:HMG box domain-containing protein n=1 Tax=Lactuca sativa TaxID=4236 RepID=A0A9R1USN6_LACSA|nr:hypothetical protein LSAT_V11C800395740 [Lactuca sativa]